MHTNPPISPPLRFFDAVICDIDGCLGPESHDPVDALSLSSIAAYNRAAISTGDRPIVTLCSGRPQPYVEAICRVIGNNSLPCVAEMGVWLYDPANNGFIRDPNITPDDLRAVQEATRYIERELVPKGLIIQPGKTASISLWHPDTRSLMGLKPTLIETFAKNNWPLRVSSTVAWLNCDLAHISKATGIARLLALTGLKKPRLAGIGDTIGDAAIREHVAFFACPSNAQEALKPCADFVSAKPEIDGVLDILERIRH